MLLLPTYLKIFKINVSKVMISILRIIILYQVLWNAILKHTRVNFELLTDIDMVMFIEHGSAAVNVPVNMRELITNIYSRNLLCICTSMLIIYTDGRCINCCQISMGR